MLSDTPGPGESENRGGKKGREETGRGERGMQERNVTANRRTKGMDGGPSKTQKKGQRPSHCGVTHFVKTVLGGAENVGCVCLPGTFSDSLLLPFAFLNKIQNHKLCRAGELKGQALSGVQV